jgi:hypothetical protein
LTARAVSSSPTPRNQRAAAILFAATAVIPPPVLTRQFSVGVINEFCFYIPMKFLRTTVLTISLLAFLSVPALAQTKIGTVDLRKLFDGYWKTKQAQTVLNDRKRNSTRTTKACATI